MQSAIEMENLAATNPQSTSATTENSSPIDPQPAYPGSVFRSHESEHGKPSVIHAYCQQAIDNGQKECIWLGIQSGRRWIAKDIQLGVEEKRLGIYELRKLSGWWKRHSLYSAVGVKEIKIRFLGFNEATNEVEIVPMDLDYTNDIGNFDRALARALNEDLEYGKCGVDVMGRSHEPTVSCRNEAFDQEANDTYCKVQHIRKLKRQKEGYEWLPSMLDYFWQNGIGSKGVEFLEHTGFIHSYDFLQFDTYQDAANPHGKTINAFKIVKGWRVRYMLWLFAAGVLGSICVVAIVTAMNQSFESGLTAGSYALALAGVFLAVLTFLSAVL